MKFRLVRYFTLTSLAAFLAVVVGLALTQRHLAVGSMIDLAENNNVSLTRTFSNSLWSHFAPFVHGAQGLSREQLQAAPQQAELRERVLGLMRGLSVVKVKVFDLNGLTVFSTEAKQIGDDKSGNAGFLSARAGRAASELTHRDTFSAFEQVIEDRDVLSSYIPIRDQASGDLVGVFEIYADVTPFLAKINRTTWVTVSIVVAMLALLYLALFFIVRRADQIIKAQEERASKAQMQIAQSEKMASLGQMVAGVAHELNTPLAFARSNLAMINDFLKELSPQLSWGGKIMRELRGCDANGRAVVRIKVNDKTRHLVSRYDENLTLGQLSQMLDDTHVGLNHIAELVVNLRDFTRLDRAKVDHYDVNKGVETTLYIAKTAIPEQITVDKDLGELPEIRCMPSQVNQILINLLTNAAHSITGNGKITIRTRSEDERVRIEVEDNGCGIAEDILPHIFEPFYTTKDSEKGSGLGLSIVHDIVREHGGEITVDSAIGRGSRFTVILPVDQDSAKAAKAA